MKASEIMNQLQQKGMVQEKTLRHAARVVTLCEALAAQFQDGTVNLELLTEAAWLHDAAKIYNKDAHHTPETVRAVLEGYSLDVNLDDLLAIIAQHRNEHFNPSSHQLESAILCICDKIDKMNKAQEKKGPKKQKKKAEEARNQYREYSQAIQGSGALSAQEFAVIQSFGEAKLDELEAAL